MRLQIHESKVEVKPGNEVVLITGDGRTFPQDMAEFLSWEIPHDVMAMGRSLNAYPGNVMHWGNVDAYEAIWWAENLPLKNNGKMPIRHTLGEHRGFDVDWEIIDEIKFEKGDNSMWYGSSALFCVYIALALGYEKIILAGCPMDSKGWWFFDEREVGPRWQGECFMAFLEFAKKSESYKVKSLSGYTAQIVGHATKAWASGLIHPFQGSQCTRLSV